ncbi:MAG TPA: PAS domain S-box protein [Usitatibacter sp.]|jgi:PAS domain S-box-containing protein|nr:PAS domain S-box protein [Usitatibacter sp.]
MVAVPQALYPDPVAHDHFVRFYEHDHLLVAEVERYLRNGIESGCGAIMIASREHSEQILAHWRERGFDPGAAQARRQLVMLDAQATLRGLLVDGAPDPVRFERLVGSVVRDAAARHGHIVAFGEMVSLLCADGLPEAALALEELWNPLCSAHGVSLFCAYRMSDCVDAGESFGQICAMHSHVLPVDDELLRERDEGEQLRRIAELQRKAVALEHELARRKAAEERLAARERELADFLENGVVALHRVGPDGTILWANRAELDMLGYTREEYIGHNIGRFHADQPLLCQILETLSTGGTLKDQSARLICKDGSIRHVLISSNGRVENGEFISTRCFTRDVTERWMAQEALRERGAVLHLAMQGARMGYWVGDLETGSLRCSHEMADLLGLPTLDDWTLESFLAVMHEDDRPGFRAAFDESVGKRSMLRCEFRARADRPEWRWFEARGEPVFDANGKAIRFYGVCADVTSRKRQEHMLEHFAAVVDCAQDVIISKTLDGTVTSWNAAATRLFGYGAEEMIGRPILTIIPPHLHAEEMAILAKLRAGEKIENYVTTRMAKDGSRCRVSISVSPVRDAGGRIIGASKIARRAEPGG